MTAKYDACGRGVCAAESGHKGTCAEASGWDAVDEPHRVQLSRRKGWRKPANTVVVARPSKWGNPFRVVAVHRSGPFDVMHGEGFIGQATGIEVARRIAVERFRRGVELGSGDHPDIDQIRAELAGKNLACWCPLDQPCHADVLLEIANAEATA